MSEPFIGEIRMFGGNFNPRGWAFCDGQQLPIAQNTALFSILGTTFGGDGRTTLGLPDMRSRVPVHAGSGTPPGLTRRSLGSRGGTETVTISTQQMADHGHALQATSNGATDDDPTDKVLASTADQGFNLYREGPPTKVDMTDDLVAAAGGGQSHNNVMPFQVVNYIIALQGLFPSRA